MPRHHPALDDRPGRLTPLAHLRAWLAAAGITEGAVFRLLYKGGGRQGSNGKGNGEPTVPVGPGDSTSPADGEPARLHRRIRDARLSDHDVARIVQARALAAGLDPERYAGHSLRASFVTAAARAGADVWKIQQVSRHKSMDRLTETRSKSSCVPQSGGDRLGSRCQGHPR